MQNGTAPGCLDFSVSVTATDGVATVKVAGELDAFTAPQLRTALCELEAQGARHVTLDIGGTQFVDSTGLSVLVGGLKRLRDTGGDLVVKSPTASTLRLFDVTGLTRIFDIC